MNVSGADGILWAAGFVSNFVLFGILLFTGRAAIYPIFTVFVGFGTVRTIVLFSLWKFSNAVSYTDVYWVLVAVDTALQLALIWEIATAVFKNNHSWVGGIRRQLILLCLVSITGAICLTDLQMTRGFGSFQTVVLKSNYCAAVLMSALFAGMIVLSSRACVNWKGHVASIAAGMAVYSLSAILIEAVDNLFGFGGHGTLFAILQTMRKLLYLVCVIYWSYSLSRTEPPRRKMSPRMGGQLSALREAVIRRNAGWGE